MTTYTAFVGAIRGLTVAGVTRLNQPPAGLSTADLPASWPMLPSGSDSILTFGSAGTVGGQRPEITCDLIFALEPVAQGTQAQNYTAMLSLIDSIVTASKALTRPTAGPTTFSLRCAVVQVGGVDYWGIVETWTGWG